MVNEHRVNCTSVLPRQKVSRPVVCSTIYSTPVGKSSRDSLESDEEDRRHAPVVESTKSGALISGGLRRRDGCW